MMRTIQISQAEVSFHALLAAVEAGEEVALTRHGRIVARMLPGVQRAASAPSRRRRGDSGITMSEDRYAIESGLISPLD